MLTDSLKTTISFCVLSLFLCQGCTRAADYTPQLQSTPLSDSKFKSDLADCRAKAPATAGETAGLILFGGLADVAMAAGGNTRMLKSEASRVDDCMEEKGYALKKDD
jgi:hypothetical protein